MATSKHASSTLRRKGRLQRLLHAINRLIDRSDAYVRESRASLEYVAQNKYFRRISEKGMTGAFGEASQTRQQGNGGSWNNGSPTLRASLKALKTR